MQQIEFWPTRKQQIPKPSAMLGDLLQEDAPAQKNNISIPFPKYIQEFPTEKQLAALMIQSSELLFGGAVAGGKSSLLLMAASQYLDHPGYAAIIFRWQLTDLKQPGALISRSHEWFGRFKDEGVHYVPSEHTWYFPAYYGDGTPGLDAKLVFGYIGDTGVKERYQSAEFQFVGFDELTQWPDATDYEFMFTRMRKRVCSIHGKDKNNDPIYNDNCVYCQNLKDIPLRMRSATNPGGPGGTWVKRRWKIVPDPKEYPDRKAALRALATGEKVNFVGLSKERHFIPSFFQDNPHVGTKEYALMLENLAESEKSRLRDGNWEVRPDSRFKRIWARYYSVHQRRLQFYDTSFRMIYHNTAGDTTSLTNQLEVDFMIESASNLTTLELNQLSIFLTVDSAASVKHGMVDDQVRRGSNSWTVIAAWGHWWNGRDGGVRLFMLDMDRFRDEIPVVVERVVRMHKKWNAVFSKIEHSGIGVAVSQYVALTGIPVRQNVKRVDKIENSTTAMLMMKRGQIFLPELAPWIEEAESEIFGWTGLPTEEDDIVDTLSDACNEMSTLSARETLQKRHGNSFGPRAIPIRTNYNILPQRIPGNISRY